MVVWYGRAGHESAGKLAAWMNMKGADVKLATRKSQLMTSDNIVVWGRQLPVLSDKALNIKAPIGNKLQELQMLLNAGIPIPGISAYKNYGWLARKNQHKDGDDLIEGGAGEFYVEPIATTYEFRVNVFNGKVFRTGLKIPKPGEKQTVVTTPVGDIPIRTGKNGWTWTYKQAPLDATNTDRAPLRDLAVKSVKALGYDFGAVDVGYRPDKRWVVFEVNSAPALEGDDLSRYGELIMTHFGEGGKQ